MNLATASFGPTATPQPPVTPTTSGLPTPTDGLRATDTPSDTLPPTEALDPIGIAGLDTPALPHTATKQFAGTTVSINYPGGWEVCERGQSLVIYDASAFDPVSQDDDFSDLASITVYIQLSNQFDLDPSLESAAPLVANALLQDAEDSTQPPGARAFRLGGHDAAIHVWQGDEGATTNMLVVVMNEERDRAVVFGKTLFNEVWASHWPTLLAMLGTTTLDGETLPTADIEEAFRNQ